MQTFYVLVRTFASCFLSVQVYMLHSYGYSYLMLPFCTCVRVTSMYITFVILLSVHLYVPCTCAYFKPCFTLCMSASFILVCVLLCHVLYTYKFYSACVLLCYASFLYLCTFYVRVHTFVLLHF